MPLCRGSITFFLLVLILLLELTFHFRAGEASRELMLGQHQIY